jgi:putative FmdB family regulatory protein
MPTYDYVCDACNHSFEHFQSITDAVLRKCPKCKKSKLRRLFGTGAAVMFKGSGFYQTDYRSDSYHKAANADKPPESKSESKSEGKSDSKPDSGKSDSKSTDAKSDPKTSAQKDGPKRKGKSE